MGKNNADKTPVFVGDRSERFLIDAGIIKFVDTFIPRDIGVLLKKNILSKVYAFGYELKHTIDFTFSDMMAKSWDQNISLAELRAHCQPFEILEGLALMEDYFQFSTEPGYGLFKQDSQNGDKPYMLGGGYEKQNGVFIRNGYPNILCLRGEVSEGKYMEWLIVARLMLWRHEVQQSYAHHVSFTWKNDWVWRVVVFPIDETSRPNDVYGGLRLFSRKT